MSRTLKTILAASALLALAAAPVASSAAPGGHGHGGGGGRSGGYYRGGWGGGYYRGGGWGVYPGFGFYPWGYGYGYAYPYPYYGYGYGYEGAFYAYPPAYPYPAPAPQGADAPPPAPQEQPAPPAAPAQVQEKRFIIYFPFDDANLTPDARRVASAAAAYAAAQPGSGLILVGYTDAAGTDGYNERLSEKRAQAVRQMLIEDGVPAEAIEAGWRGEHDQAVRTAAGVKEPANRRVTIVVTTQGADPSRRAQASQQP